MLKSKNLKKIFIVVMVFMVLMLMQSSVFATSNTLVITGNTTSGGGLQQILTVNSITNNNTTSSGITQIPTTNSVNNGNSATNSNTKVTVTVTANKQVQALSGWTLSTDKKVLTKTYTANTTESITLTDTAGNKSDPIQIKVDLSLANGGTNVDYTLGNSDTSKPLASVKYTKTNGSDYTKENLPKTGIDYTALFIIVVCLISGVYAYIKIRDYNQIKY